MTMWSFDSARCGLSRSNAPPLQRYAWIRCRGQWNISPDALPPDHQTTAQRMAFFVLCPCILVFVITVTYSPPREGNRNSKSTLSLHYRVCQSLRIRKTCGYSTALLRSDPHQTSKEV